MPYRFDINRFVGIQVNDFSGRLQTVDFLPNDAAAAFCYY